VSANARQHRQGPETSRRMRWRRAYTRRCISLCSSLSSFIAAPILGCQSPVERVEFELPVKCTATEDRRRLSIEVQRQSPEVQLSGAILVPKPEIVFEALGEIQEQESGEVRFQWNDSWGGTVSESSRSLRRRAACQSTRGTSGRLACSRCFATESSSGRGEAEVGIWLRVPPPTKVLLLFRLRSAQSDHGSVLH
jgi:hypothetical protein